MGRPPSQLARWHEPALREQGPAARLPEVEGDPEVVGRHERVATKVEADQVFASEHRRALDLRKEGERGIDKLEKEVPACDIECWSKEQKVFVICPHQFAEHREFVDAALVDSQDREFLDRGCGEASARSELLP